MGNGVGGARLSPMYRRISFLVVCLAVFAAACGGSTDNAGLAGGDAASGDSTTTQVDGTVVGGGADVAPADSEDVAFSSGDVTYTFGELAEALPGVPLDGTDVSGAVGSFIGESIVANELEVLDATERTEADEALVERLIQNGFAPDQPGGEGIIEQIRFAWRLADLTLLTEEEIALDGELNPFAYSETCSRHVLVETEAEAQEVYDLAIGGADFAELAVEYSTGPSGPDGGDLGCNSPGRMVPEFDEALSSIGVGEIGGPVQTEFGWHVVTIYEQTLNEDELGLQSFLNQLDQASEAFFAFAAETPVEVDPRLGTWQSESFQLVPASQEIIIPDLGVDE